MIPNLVDEWRKQAATFRDHAQESVAIAYERCASRLESLLETTAATPLTLTDASVLGGYTEDHLGRMLRENRIPNAGRKGSPRIRRADVPIKPGHVASTEHNADLDRTQIVRSAINEGAG